MSTLLLNAKAHDHKPYPKIPPALNPRIFVVVLQGLVNKLTDYGIPEGNILGIRYGFRGFYDRHIKPMVLTKQNVDGIQLQGGTILGTSRGGSNIK